MADELNIDLSNYKDRVGQRVAPGRYRVVVDDVELDKSNAGNDMINVWFRVVGGEYDGAIIIDRLTQTEKALFRTVGFMQGIGLPTPKKRLRVNLRQWLGKQLEIDVEDGDPYNGRVKSEVRGYVRITKSESAKAAEEGDDDFGGLDPIGDEPEDEVAREMHGMDADEVDLEQVNLG
jgi:hypothetical protein